MGTRRSGSKFFKNMRTSHMEATKPPTTASICISDTRLKASARKIKIPPLSKNSRKELKYQNLEPSPPPLTLGGCIFCLSASSGGDGGEWGVRCMVARWQNLIPSFPWIAPGWRGGGAIQGKEGIKFCSVAQRSHSPEARRAKHIRSNNPAIAIWQP